jgi:transcriptional regulator with XRE-family HTH domain
MDRSEAARQLPLRLKKKGWTQADLTRRMSDDLGHVAEGLVNRWISGAREPSGPQVGWLQINLDLDAGLWTVPARRVA